MFDDQQSFASLLHRTAALWRTRLDERLRPWGMTQATWRTLWVLRMAEEPYNQSTLAARLGIETPTLVRIIDRMEKLQLLRREPDAHDRRQKYVVITEAGLALAHEIEGEVVRMREEMLAGIDQAELRQGIALFERVLANAQPAKPGTP
jgi:MarR family transcriptional regulator, transcriptional regulator for hemolysin